MSDVVEAAVLGADRFCKAEFCCELPPAETVVFGPVACAT